MQLLYRLQDRRQLTPPAHKQHTVSFLNPSAILVGGGGTHDEHQMEWDMQLGSLKYPQTPCSSLGESFSLLRQATNVYDESIRCLSCTTQSYGSLGFVIGVPMQSVPGTPFSGISTRSGDLLTFRAKHLSSDNTVNGARHIYISLLAEQLVEVREGSVSVLD